MDGITTKEVEEQKRKMIEQVKNMRVCIDSDIKLAQSIQKQLANQKGIREVSLVITKLQEGKMWAGKILEELGSELPKEFRDEVGNNAVGGNTGK